MRGMNGYNALYWSNHFWTALSVLSAFVVAGSSLADRRRTRRKDIEAVGFMPWTAITVMAVLVMVLSAALALKSV
jgi:hypothetical protein